MDQILKNIGKKLLLSLVCFSGAIAVLVWAVEQGKLSPQGFLGAILIVAVGMVVSALVFIATSTKGFTSNGTRSAVDKIGGKRSTVSVRAAKAFLVLLGVLSQKNFWILEAPRESFFFPALAL